jgi:hypothetical protein
MHQPFAFPDLPERFETSARCTFGAAYINLRIMAPLKAGVPLITWQGGAPIDSDGYRVLRICVELVSKARDTGDAAAIAALAGYPRVAAILDAALVAVSRDTALVSAIDHARAARAGLKPEAHHG